MDWLISTASAQATGAPPGASGFQFFAMLVVFTVALYFFIIRPQNKRAKEHSAMVSAIEKGAEVVTSGGILGKVVDISDQILTIEISSGVSVKVQRHTITQVLPTGTIKSV